MTRYSYEINNNISVYVILNGSARNDYVFAGLQILLLTYLLTYLLACLLTKIAKFSVMVPDGPEYKSKL